MPSVLYVRTPMGSRRPLQLERSVLFYNACVTFWHAHADKNGAVPESYEGIPTALPFSRRSQEQVFCVANDHYHHHQTKDPCQGQDLMLYKYYRQH